MLRRKHLAATVALVVSFSTTLTLSSFGDPGDPAPYCPTSKMSFFADPHMGISWYEENEIAGTFECVYYNHIDITCADTPKTESCCSYCSVFIAYKWNPVIDEYQVLDTSDIQTSQTRECGSITKDIRIEGDFGWSIGDYKLKLKYSKYDCRKDDDDYCCIGCQDPTWSMESVVYIGTKHD